MIDKAAIIQELTGRLRSEIGKAPENQELEQELQLLQELSPDPLGEQDEIGLGALVEVEFNQRIHYYYLSTTSGGSVVKISDRLILVISAFSPLGAAMMGAKRHERFHVETPQGARHYRILSIL